MKNGLVFLTREIVAPGLRCTEAPVSPTADYLDYVYIKGASGTFGKRQARITELLYIGSMWMLYLEYNNNVIDEKAESRATSCFPSGHTVNV